MLENIPKFWLWTWKLQGDLCEEVVETAINLGYNYLDTAQIYGNEIQIGNAWKKSQISREKLWLTSKVWFENYTKLEESVEQSLKDLQTEYLDLLLLHRPTNFEQDKIAFAKLLQLQQQGKVRFLGVSNFTIKQLKKLRLIFPEYLFNHQIERSICLDQHAMELFAQDRKITLTAYSPLGQGNLLRLNELQEIAEKHHTTPAQIALARFWDKKHANVIAKASNPERLLANLEAKKIILDAEDLEKIDQMPKNYRYCNPPFAPNWDK